MSKYIPDFYCSACKQLCETVSQEFTSPCCWEPLITKEGADINADMIFEYLDMMKED